MSASNGNPLWLVLGGGLVLAAIATRGKSALDALADELVGVLPARLAQWSRQIAAAAIANAPRDLDAPRFARFIAAVMDRESNGGNVLVPHGPTGTGDYGHGLGLMQLDDRAHPGLKEQPELWQDAAWNIDQGAQELAAHFNATDASLDELARLQRAADVYNAGSRALSAADPDTLTTGGDYGTDVLGRLSRYT